MPNLLVAENVSKSYGSFTALNDVSLQIPKGSIFGLLGPNGAGKTTLIRIINQITYPDKGRVLFEDTELNASHIRSIGYLPEERGLYKSMRVGEQALYLAQLKGMSKKQAKEKLHYWFDRLEIGHWWDKKIQELSKGMAQKIQFVVTVLHEPKLLIFDEPFSGFDPINANLIKDEIIRLNKNGTTVIFSTHRMESVEELCDHIALIDRSNKILDGKLIDIKRSFKNGTFEIGIHCENQQKVERQLSQRFNVKPGEFRSFDGALSYRVQLGENGSPNDLLHYLTSLGSVSHFVEVVPTVNEIFIEFVKDNVNG